MIWAGGVELWEGEGEEFFDFQMLIRTKCEYTEECMGSFGAEFEIIGPVQSMGRLGLISCARFYKFGKISSVVNSDCVCYGDTVDKICQNMKAGASFKPAVGLSVDFVVIP